MRKALQILLVILINSWNLFGQEIPVPKNYSIVDTISGDLDKDGMKEFVVAYNTAEENDDYESIPRELIIYKQDNGKLKVWKKSQQALYGSRDGGMSGDPFEEMRIENNTLLISQSGGSSWKWGHTDRYRYQDGEFYLIGYTSLAGKPCEYWQDVDFNLSTGKMIVKKEYENCENDGQEIYKREDETLYEKGLKITLQNRSEKEIKIVTPKYGHEIYVAVKN